MQTSKMFRKTANMKCVFSIVLLALFTVGESQSSRPSRNDRKMEAILNLIEANFDFKQLRRI